VDAGLKAEQWRDAIFTDGEFRKPAAGGTIDVRDKASPVWADGPVAMPTPRKLPNGAG
jgi:hypothetical protein